MAALTTEDCLWCGRDFDKPVDSFERYCSETCMVQAETGDLDDDIMSTDE